MKFRMLPASLSLLFLVCCWVFLRKNYLCTKVVIFYNIGKVIWASLFLLMGQVDCILPGLSVSAL